MLVTTWNVNSLRARMPRVEEFLDLHLPGVVLLQETKAAPDQFPHLELQAAGYTAVDHSAGRWAGVAVLVRDGHAIGDVQVGLPGSPVADEARWVEAEVDGVRFVSVYVVNGRTLDDPMFAAKLDFLDAMAARLAELRAQGPVVLGGDLNIAPADVDVYEPAAFVGGTHVTEDERGRLRGDARRRLRRRLPAPAPGRGGLHLVGLPRGPLPQGDGPAHRPVRRVRRPRRGDRAAAGSTATSARAPSPPTTPRCCCSSTCRPDPVGMV